MQGDMWQQPQRIATMATDVVNKAASNVKKQLQKIQPTRTAKASTAHHYVSNNCAFMEGNSYPTSTHLPCDSLPPVLYYICFSAML